MGEPLQGDEIKKIMETAGRKESQKPSINHQKIENTSKRNGSLTS